jgi:TonB family protein
MPIQVKRFLMIGLLAIATDAAMTSSGAAAEPDAARKATKKVSPVYPQLTRKILLSGTVRLAAMVAPAGEVTSTEVIGGHPILAAAATDAAKQWRYQAAARESRELLVFTFAPQ